MLQSKQGKDTSTVTCVFIDEKVDFKEVKLFSQVMHVTSNQTESPVLTSVTFLLQQPVLDCFISS
jgi:hypothetical protein